MNEHTWKYKVQVICKRSIDISLSFLGLLFLSPMFLIIAAAIKLDSKGPIIYAQQRVGKNGKAFRLYKFRSMHINTADNHYMDYLRRLIESERENNGKGLPYRKLKDDTRVTRVGRFLRRYYFDEFPQLWNILKGDMSLVGPRPHVQFEVDNYSPEQRRRLSTKPGVTGLWQAMGKVDCSFNEMIDLDLQYIDNWNLWYDFQVIITTLEVILRGGERFWAPMVQPISPLRKKLNARRKAKSAAESRIRFR